LLRAPLHSASPPGPERKGAQSWQVLVLAAAGTGESATPFRFKASGGAVVPVAAQQKGSDAVNRDELCDVSDQHMDRTNRAS
jgi:hypothetical protein